ncbi:MAG: T9SS type A sorting domain-containing protein [Ignavibacteria bacterium]|nr:T9SS type A sorting domain-containing protein [Ignavibacteria bacterium]
MRFGVPSNLTGKFYQVKLSVFNALGKPIQHLVNKRLNAGSFEVEFSGIRFASGMYFYKLEAGSFVETKRMILLK